MIKKFISIFMISIMFLLTSCNREKKLVQHTICDTDYSYKRVEEQTAKKLKPIIWKFVKLNVYMITVGAAYIALHIGICNCLYRRNIDCPSEDGIELDDLSSNCLPEFTEADCMASLHV